MKKNKLEKNYIYIYILISFNLVKSYGVTTVSKPNFYYIIYDVKYLLFYLFILE